MDRRPRQEGSSRRGPRARGTGLGDREANLLLRESEERFAAIHDNAPFAIVLSRMPEGEFVSVNDAFLRLFEFDREDVIGRTSVELGISDPESRARVAEVLRERGAVRDLEVVRRTRSGSERVLSLNVDRVAIGGRDHFLTTIVDVTDRKRIESALRASEERFRVALQGGKVVVFNQDRDLRYTWIHNPHPAFDSGSILGKTDAELLGEGSAARLSEVKRRIMTTGLPAREEVEIRIGEEHRHYDLIGEPLRDAAGAVVGVTCAAVDVTARVKAESESRRAAREADEQRGRAQAALEADRRKDEFLAMLSHELRNPLAPIRSGLYVLDQAAPGSDPARRAQESIGRQIEHMTRLIDDLLDVTRITRGKMLLQRERLDLNELARLTVEDHRGPFLESGVKLEAVPAAGEVWVNGDRTRLAQAIGNLLQNAAKFTPRGGGATLSVSTDADRGEALVRVRDTGCGISSEMVPRVFEAFTQAETTIDRSKGGLGLGLALVKALVEMHGGSVAAESGGAGRGTTFTVALPLAPQALAEPPASGAGSRRAAHRVLVIDDNADGAESLRDALALCGHEVEVAYDGPGGIRKARAFLPDVVLCDIGLPEMDGHAVARALRSDPILGTARLVALSGYAGTADVAKARAAGFDAHLAKPSSIEALEAILDGDAGGVR